MSADWRVVSIRGATSLLLAMAMHLAVPAGASARAAAPSIRAVAPLRVAAGGSLRITADRLGATNYALFAVTGRRVRAVRASRPSPRRLVVRVPSNAVTGRLRVRAAGRPASRASRRITILRPREKYTPAPRGSANAFAGNAMWIWILSRSDGGNASAIVARARAAGVNTVLVKAADGTSLWQQFSPALLSALKGAGLRVCGWQYVYGTNPNGEAATAAQAIALGADCFVIDAEAEFEGRYAQAQTYMTQLRARTGPAYPLALSSFPYVDYHPGFPYSVFLGPGGAQANLPQMYWKAIGTSVDQAFAHTWPLNRVYGVPTFPVGQTYQSPSAGELLRFRSLTTAYGATGVSWWDWQETTSGGWGALAATAPASAAPSAATSWPSLGPGSRGDLVVWAQQHLTGAGYRVTADGSFGASTRDALVRFQTASGLAQTGRLDGASWPALLRGPVARARWATAASRPTASGPRSAALRPRRDEIPILGRGG
jgi:hypothetical protein